jgi:RND family efflux transporter MFP subunit
MHRSQGLGVLAVAGFLLLTPALAAPPEVEVQQPIVREIADVAQCTGRVEAAEVVEVRSRVGGELVKMHVKPGAEVKKGELLFEIESRVLQAALEKARAEVAQAEARVRIAEAELNRAKKLFENKVISNEEFSKLESAHLEARAALEVVHVHVDRAKLELDFTKIHAPINGRIGLPAVTPGNLVGTDGPRLATIVSVDPVYVSFDLDERTYLRLQRLLRDGKIKEGALSALVGLSNEDGYPHRATVEAFDNRINPETGTIRVRAVLANKDGLFTPGLSARVQLQLGDKRKALFIPKTAILPEKGEPYVFRVTPSETVQKQKVTLGAAQGDLVAIESGLEEKDQVVIRPPKELKPGDAVKPKHIPE